MDMPSAKAGGFFNTMATLNYPFVYRAFELAAGNITDSLEVNLKKGSDLVGKMEFHIRKAGIDDAESIAKVHIGSWRTTYKGIVADDILDKLNVQSRTERWESILGNQSEDYRIFVAENQFKQVIGFLDGGMNREKAYDYDAEMYAFYLLEHVQKQGIGREMVKSLAEELQSMGFKSMIVWVLKDNPAKVFYEKLGGVYVDTKYLEGLQLDEVAYGWKDVGTLTKKTTR